jgi:hypothetical protein
MRQMRISTTQVSSVMLRSKKLEIRKKGENWKSRRMKTKQSAMKLSQIRRGIKYSIYQQSGPIRIRVRIDPLHPLVCRKRRQTEVVLRMWPEKPRPRVTAGVAR